MGTESSALQDICWMEIWHSKQPWWTAELLNSETFAPFVIMLCKGHTWILGFCLFSFFFASHFILIEQSLPAGQTGWPSVFSLELLSHFCLQSNFVPCHRFWKVKVFPLDFFSDHICQIVTKVANQRLNNFLLLDCYSLSASIDGRLPPTLWYNFPGGNKILPFSSCLVKPLPRMSSAVKAAAKDLISGGCRRGRAYWFRYKNIPSAPPSVNLLPTWSYFRGEIFPGFEAQGSLAQFGFYRACWLGWGSKPPSVWCCRAIFWIMHAVNFNYWLCSPLF